MEDLGKVNAFYAPPPPARAVQAFGDSPRRRTTSSGLKVKPALALPREIPKSASKPLPMPIQTSFNGQGNLKGQEISIALPLSPVNSVGGGCEEENSGGIYFTVEDDYDEESGKPMLQLVKIPK